MTRAPAPTQLPVQLGGMVDDKFRVERVLGITNEMAKLPSPFAVAVHSIPRSV